VFKAFSLREKVTEGRMRGTIYTGPLTLSLREWETAEFENDTLGM
jgi:hypothetical protein